MAYTDASKLMYGGDLMVFIDNTASETASNTSGITSGATAYMAVAFAKSSKLTINMDSRDISSKDSGNFKELISGRLSWSMSTDGLLNYATTVVNQSVDDLYGYMILRKKVWVVFAKKTSATPPVAGDTSVKYFKGQAYITSLEMNASDNEDGTYSISLEGSGDLIMY